MANEHYKQGDVETRDFIYEVQSYCPWMTPEEIIDSFNFIKYARRAGIKDGEPWEKDARKTADYITHFKYGKYIDQRPVEQHPKTGYASFSDFERFMDIVRDNNLGVEFVVEDDQVVVKAKCYQCEMRCSWSMEELFEVEDSAISDDADNF